MIDIEAIIEAVANRVLQHVKAQPEYVDQSCAPIGRREYLRAARGGEFKTWRKGRKVYARRADVVAWVESETHSVGAASPLDMARVRAKAVKTLAEAGLELVG
jgi:hypothetical protein